MLGRAVKRAATEGGTLSVCAVTVLTSLDAADLADLGIAGDARAAATKLARIAYDEGVRWFVCSPTEVADLRSALGPDATLVTPGVRPAATAVGDQKRTATPEDAIRAIDGRPVTTFEDMRKIVAASPGRTLSLLIHRGTQDLTVPATIKPSPQDPAKGQLGVIAGGGTYVRLWPGAALVAGFTQMATIFWLTLTGLVHIITTGHGVHDLAGPIGVIAISGQVAKLGFAAVVSFTAMLSINLGLVNLLPIPVLDGGHLMFYAAEALRGRPLPARALDYGTRLGFAFIASFFLFASWNDLVHTGAVKWVTQLFG